MYYYDKGFVGKVASDIYRLSTTIFLPYPLSTIFKENCSNYHIIIFYKWNESVVN
jgi:hypothetical protein